MYVCTCMSFYLMLPVKCLREPPEDLLIRDCNKAVVPSLKQEVIENPCSDVTPNFMCC